MGYERRRHRSLYQGRHARGTPPVAATDSDPGGPRPFPRRLEDFVARLASHGTSVVKTGFIMREFCEKRGFRLDRRWGGLVRVLSEEPPAVDRLDLV